MNSSRPTEKVPKRLPAYYNAERMLLAFMMADKESADYVRQKLGDRFNNEAHAALAAYLYAFYAQGHEPDAVRFMATLHDGGLESDASAILNAYADQAFNAQVMEDCIGAVLKQYTQRDTIKELREQADRADRSGDAISAARLWKEIIALEKQLKSL